MKERNDNMIYIWRIIFTNMIAAFHFGNVYNIAKDMGMTNGWYISVEFFFIVSGFLLYRQCKSNKYESNVACIKDKYFNIYPIYIICFIITFILKTANDPASRVARLYDSFWEIIGLHCIGLNRGWNYINGTSWYISALFICTFFLYFLLKNYEKVTVNFLIPLSIMVFYSWFYRKAAVLDFHIVDIEGFFINGALMRGIAGMGLGVIAARLNDYLKKNAKNILLWKGMSVTGFLLVIIHSLKNGYSANDFPMAFILCICVAIGFLPNEKIKVPGIIKYWSKATLGVYLIHEVFRVCIFPQYFGYPESIRDRFKLCMLYLLMVNVAGILLTVLSGLAQKVMIKCKSIFLK
ncbi:MAG: acyltransferase [Lachnospiraceae bacterium]|nr:acyltransferase [Lachnospiraceae bacterium]